MASTSNSPGPVSAGSVPQLANVPTIAITSVGGTAAPATLLASYSTPDITLAAGTQNPVQVVMSLTNTPVDSSTTIAVRLVPQGSPSSVTVASADHTGTFASSTATASVNLAVGAPTLLQASAATTLTGQQASLFPTIAGEPVQRVKLAASMGEASTITLVTRSGREVRLDEFDPEQQLHVAQAWAALAR